MSNLDSVVLISSTRNSPEDFRKNSPLNKSLESLYNLYEKFETKNFKEVFKYGIHYQNTDGLSKSYNSHIESYLNKFTDTQHFIFVHDDVEIHDLFLIEKLTEYHKGYDVIGIAGSTEFLLNRPKLAWHISNKNSWRGAVTHPTPEDPRILYCNTFGYCPSSVAVIDGLFISITKKALEAGLRFNENYEFDFYDTALCLDAYLKHLTVGVIPLNCVHYSHGRGIIKPEYDKVQEKFRKEYTEKLKG